MNIISKRTLNYRVVVVLYCAVPSLITHSALSCAKLRVQYANNGRAAAVCSLLSRDRCSGHAALNKTKRLQTSRDAVKRNFKRRVHIAPETHKRLFCMMSVMTKSPRSAIVVDPTCHLLLLSVTIRLCLNKLGLIISESPVW